MLSKRLLGLVFCALCVVGCNSTSGGKSTNAAKTPFFGESQEKASLRKQVEKDSFPSAGNCVGAARS